MDFDTYLASANALRQTESADGKFLQPGQIFDGMRVIAFLGRGATSEVWRVHDLRQRRDYALKIFTPAADTPVQARQRFLTEARALDEFRHPNLMRRYRLQDAGDHPYFTMDVLHPLPDRLDERALLRLLDDVLSGLDALHARGIVHRDLKPSNILLDDSGRGVLADLGVAHIADVRLAKRLGDTDTPNPTLVHESPFVGTPRYAAPEQLAGDAVTPATDLYALGVVIEQLLGGKIPRRWRPLLNRMTAARPSLRLSSVRQVRRRLGVLRFRPRILCLLGVVITALTVGILWRASRPDWIELSDTSAEIITLAGEHYFQKQLHCQPLAEPPHGTTFSATNGIDRQFEKMFATRYRRRPVYIQGEGTFKCPDLAFCEVHLGSGVTFITSGRVTPDGDAIKDPLPPPDADWDNSIGYPAFVVESGAELIFTDNDNYPAALIRHQPAAGH